MRNIFLVTVIAFSLISCSEDKDKIKVDTAVATLTRTAASVDELIELNKTTQDKELAKLDIIDFSDEALKKLDPSSKERRELFKSKIDGVKSEFNEFNEVMVRMQYEINSDLDQAKLAQKLFGEGKSIEEISKEIDVKVLNTEQLDNVIENRKKLFESMKAEQSSLIDLVIKKYNMANDK